MAEDKSTDSYESDDLDSATPTTGGAHLARPGATDGGGLNVGVDQPGENLAHAPVDDDVAPYRLSPDETEAEELAGETFEESENLVDDATQLTEAEEEARVAESSRPRKRKDRRPVEAAVPADDEAVVAPSGASAVVSARPRKVVAAKDHATPRQHQSGVAIPRKRVGVGQFVREVGEELRKVVWPTGSQLWQYFVVVLAFVLFIIAFVSLLDFAFGWALLKLFG